MSCQALSGLRKGYVSMSGTCAPGEGGNPRNFLVGCTARSPNSDPIPEQNV